MIFISVSYWNFGMISMVSIFALFWVTFYIFHPIQEVHKCTMMWIYSKENYLAMRMIKTKDQTDYFLIIPITWLLIYFLCLGSSKMSTVKINLPLSIYLMAIANRTVLCCTSTIPINNMIIESPSSISSKQYNGNHPRSNNIHNTIKWDYSMHQRMHLPREWKYCSNCSFFGSQVVQSIIPLFSNSNSLQGIF